MASDVLSPGTCNIIVNSRVRGGKSGMGPSTSDQCGQNPREGGLVQL